MPKFFQDFLLQTDHQILAKKVYYQEENDFVIE